MDTKVSIFLVPLIGLASLEPPAKQSTGLFFRPRANAQPYGCLLLIQVLPYCHIKNGHQSVHFFGAADRT